jgi:RNA 3'-terminal phosphate cyclase (ATP)
MIHIDGSLGEGGGQVLRSSLACSILTGQALRITGIRARRSQPGLRPQHLKSVDAAAAVSKANVQGAAHGSTSLVFEPQEIRSGRYKFDIGTAGATTLVLQTIMLPLSFAPSASTVMISGGTHVPWSPCFHFIDLHWLPFLHQIGYNAQVSLDQAGFYPQGGGRITTNIRPASPVTPLDLTRRGELLHIRGISAVANLDISIAERQKLRALRRLESRCADTKIKITRLPSPGKGTLLLLLAEFEHSRCCYFALGERGLPAEQVADQAVDALEAFLETDGAVDQYLADQLLLPLALAKEGSTISTSSISAHLTANAAVLQAFLPVEFDIQGEIGKPGLVRIMPSA